MEPPSLLRRQFQGIQRRALAVGLTASVLAVALAVRDPRAFLQSYLTSFLFWLGFPLGSMAIAMLHHLTGGSWGFAIRRLLEASMRTLPLMAVLFVPILLGVELLYEWARPEVVQGDAILQEKALYLNVPFFAARAALYFSAWILCAWLIGRVVQRQDRTGDPKLVHRLRTLSGPGLAMYALTTTFASVDWAMSLEPHWFSTVYGVMFIVGQVLSTLALAITAAAWLAHREPFSRWIHAGHFHDLGNLLLAFVMLWAYISFSQYLIIWSGNLAEETPWVLHRTAGGWQVVALALVLFHFAVPFFLLLSRRSKRQPQVLAKIAAALLVLRFVDLHWLVSPAFHPTGLHVAWSDLVVLVGMGGLWLAHVLQNLKGRPLISLQDAQLETALEQSPRA